jgi:hypothetical protein
MTEWKPIRNSYTETTVTRIATNYDVSGRSDVEQKNDEEDEWLTEYLETQKANKKLYNQKKIKIRVYPLGINKRLLPRKII